MDKKSGFRKFIGNLSIVLSIALTVYMCVIMVQRINAIVLKDSYITIFKYELILCVLFIVLAFDLRFGFLTAMRAKFVKFLGWLIRIVLILAACGVVFLFGKIVAGGMIPTPGGAENAIVLGLALQNGQPTEDLISRVDTAAEYSREYPYSTLILTGGNPNENGMTEAAVMRELLIERGVAADRMVLEDKAATTIDNFKNTAQIASTTSPIVLITSDYHMDRASRTAEDAGFSYVMKRPAPSSKVEYVANVMWEVVQELNRLKSMIL